MQHCCALKRGLSQKVGLGSGLPAHAGAANTTQDGQPGAGSAASQDNKASSARSSGLSSGAVAGIVIVRAAAAAAVASLEVSERQRVSALLGMHNAAPLTFQRLCWRYVHAGRAYADASA